MTNRKILFGLLALLVVIAAVTLWLRPGTKTPTFGAILPLTGDLAKFGSSFRNGIELAVSESPIPVKIVYEDDAADPNRSALAFRKLVDADRVPLVIGGAISSGALSIAPIADREQVVLLSPAATAPALSEFHYFFRVQPSDFYEGTLMARFSLNDLQVKQMAIVYVNNDWGKGLADVFAREYQRLGGVVNPTYAFERQATDFRTIIDRLKASKTERVYLLGYLDELLSFLQQGTELGLKAKYLGAFSLYDPEILAKIPPEHLEGSYMTVPVYDPASSNKVVSNFAASYKKSFNADPDQFAAHAYDCAKLALQALKEGKKDGKSIASYIRSLGNFEGVTGEMNFRSGDVVKPYRIFTVAKGSYSYVKTIAP